MTDPLLLELPTVINTDRLILRPPQAGDGPEHFAALTESLPELRRFLAALPWVAADPSVEASELYCRNGQVSFVARKDLPFFLFERSTGQFVGAAGLLRIDWKVPRAEVGYWVRSSRAGQGFVSEAVQALTDYAFAHLHAVRVELVTDEENRASRKVAERCQFALEAVLRDNYRMPDGSLKNTCIYARFPTTPA